MHIKSLTIKNLRSISSATLALNKPGDTGLKYPNVNVILGGNGFGKTTILRAAALSTLGPLLSTSSGFVADGLIRRADGWTQPVRSTKRPRLSDHARIEADVILGPDELTVTSRSRSTAIKLTSEIRAVGSAEILSCEVSPKGMEKKLMAAQFEESDPAFFVAGYGATRRVEASSRVDESARLKSRQRKYERVASLFEDHVSLVPLSYWLPQYEDANKGRYKQVVNLINRLLPDACRMQAQSAKVSATREHLFEMNGVALPFRALSDGYKAYVGWIGDMLFHVCMGIGKGLMLRDMHGVVLIDEIDLHLHPEWQKVVVPTLAEALPNVQFIVTTHSPLVVGSLEAGNLFTLRAENNAVEVTQSADRVHGRSAEQILLSPYFGLQSTRAPETAEQLAQLARAAASGTKGASASYLRLLAEGAPKAAATSRKTTGSARSTRATAKRKG